MNIEREIDELQALVSKYDTESFAGFFAYFIRKRLDAAVDIDLNKFDSKLKDFLYLIGLNVFSEKKGIEKFDYTNGDLGLLADKLDVIKNFSRAKKYSFYTKESMIHEMAFRNHFDNGVLSYIEQDLERLRTVFTPFEDYIIENLGFDIDFLLQIVKEIGLITVIRYKHVIEFSHSKEFAEFNQRAFSKKMSFSGSFDLLPEKIQDAFISFQSKPYDYLIFTAEDLYRRLPKEKVDKFLEIFICRQIPDGTVRYYSAENPFELAPILKLSGNRYLNLYQKQIPISIYKRLSMFFFNDKNHISKLLKHREKSLEKKVAEIFESFFPSKGTFFYKNYFVEDNHEQDLLIIYKGTAIIIEIKASKLREPFRDLVKAIKRLKDDFKDSIQYGFDQCKRIEDYFFGTELFDIKDEKRKLLYKVNPIRIHSVYSIVVTLERFGSLQTDLSLMLNKHEAVDYPWSVYVDDLETFLSAMKQNINNPIGKFLNFLKLRKDLHGKIYAIDELDVCASYLQNPEKFKRLKENKKFLRFSPYEQRDFDKLYFSSKLFFKEKPLPDDFYKFGI